MKEARSTNLAKRPITVAVTLFLLLILALLWLAFSLLFALGGNISYYQVTAFKWLISALAFLASLMLVGLCYFLRKRSKFAWYGMVLILSAMTLAGFLDQLGLIDILSILLTVFPLALLIKDRKWYLRK